jgi:hypothetical protein
MTGTVFAEFSPLTQILCPFNAKVHVCTLKMTEDALKCLLRLFLQLPLPFGLQGQVVEPDK